MCMMDTYLKQQQQQVPWELMRQVPEDALLDDDEDVTVEASDDGGVNILHRDGISHLTMCLSKEEALHLARFIRDLYFDSASQTA